MDLQAEYKRIKKMDESSIISIMQDCTVRIMDFLIGLERQTTIFEEIESDASTMFIHMCVVPVIVDGLVKESEFELFKKAVLGSGLDDLTYPQFYNMAVSTPFMDTIKSVNQFIDKVGKYVPVAKDEILTFSLCFAAIDGDINKREIELLKTLYA